MKTAIGIVVLMCMVLVAVPLSRAQWPLGEELAKASKKAESSPNLTTAGRFQVFTSPNIKSQTFMIDSDTGKIWIIKKNDTTGEFSLGRVPVEEVDSAHAPGTATGKPEGAKK